MDERTRQALVHLTEMIQQHPEARVVADVGRSMFSGWGDLTNVVYYPDQDAIELEFE